MILHRDSIFQYLRSLTLFLDLLSVEFSQHFVHLFRNNITMHVNFNLHEVFLYNNIYLILKFSCLLSVQITGIISRVHNILCPVSIDDCRFKGYDMEAFIFLVAIFYLDS